MAEREVRLVYIAWMKKPQGDYDEPSQQMAMSGEKVNTSDLAKGEEERLDALGAFTDSPDVEVDSQRQYFGPPVEKDPESGLPHEGPPAESVAGTVPSELSDDQIDSLTGSDLDDACEAAGIDTDKGGSLSDGALSADEKRDALKAYAKA
jgi:hypothetical protein